MWSSAILPRDKMLHSEVCFRDLITEIELQSSRYSLQVKSNVNAKTPSLFIQEAETL
jgi:hypothetical protein